MHVSVSENVQVDAPSLHRITKLLAMFILRFVARVGWALRSVRAKFDERTVGVMWLNANVDSGGFEPPTPRLQSGCSSN